MIRAFDIFFSLIAILILLPLFCVIIIILSLSGEGEVFYVQERIGKHEKKFSLLKFATMLKDSPNMSLGTITIKDDPRILKIGGFLRNTKINELPQLFNILKGDMSFIGPRPLTRKSFNFYSKKTKMLLTTVRPGLSGLGSIIFRDEEKILSSVKNPLEFHRKIITPYKGQLEEFYVKKEGVYIYLILIFLTMITVLYSKNKLKWFLIRDIPQPNNNLKDHLIN